MAQVDLAFVGIVGFALVLMVIFPQIITWLPELMFVRKR